MGREPRWARTEAESEVIKTAVREILARPLSVATASYCRDDGGDSGGRFGDHAHQHHGNSFASTGDSPSDKTTSTSDDDPDWGDCHPNYAQPLASTGREVVEAPTQTVAPIDLPRYHSRPTLTQSSAPTGSPPVRSARTAPQPSARSYRQSLAEFSDPSFSQPGSV